MKCPFCLFVLIESRLVVRQVSVEETSSSKVTYDSLMGCLKSPDSVVRPPYRSPTHSLVHTRILQIDAAFVATMYTVGDTIALHDFLIPRPR